MLHRLLVAALIVASVPLAAIQVAAADDPGGDPTPTTDATFGGSTIDLGDGSWDGARACAVLGAQTRCFDSEDEMDAWLAQNAAPSGAVGMQASAVTPRALTCSSSLRLYEHGGFGGRILYLSSRGRWFNLRDFSFNNITSSFRVGACTSYLAEYANGGGAWYPGSPAWANVGVMPGSWNDRISSAYLV